jgi:hypothetical protein
MLQFGDEHQDPGLAGPRPRVPLPRGIGGSSGVCPARAPPAPAARDGWPRCGRSANPRCRPAAAADWRRGHSQVFRSCAISSIVLLRAATSIAPRPAVTAKEKRSGSRRCVPRFPAVVLSC